MNRHVSTGGWGVPLACGPFRFERYGPSLRWLHAGNVECIRMVGVVVRDRAWRTLLPESMRTRRVGERWSLSARTRVGEAALAWSMSIMSAGRGVRIVARLTAMGTVTTNRAGLVVLLPAATYAGARYVTSHTSGRTTRGALPRAIAPHQPLLDVRESRFATRQGTVLSLTFEGETFEMEDQRNWLDPTFKLYGRALSRAVPYRIRDGQCVEQAVTIALHRTGVARPTRLRVRRGPLPPLGVATSGTRIPGEPSTRALVRRMTPAFVLHRASQDAIELPAAVRFAAALDVPLLVQGTGTDTVLALAMRQAAPNAGIVGGTFSDFVMLNRRGAQRASRVGFALCPTVHARDDRSLVETLDALPLVFDQARAIAGAREFVVGPCALRRPLSPRTGRPADRPRQADGTPYDVDPRQGTLLAAAWLACVIAVAATRGVDRLCGFEAAGARGLIADDGRRTPAYAVFEALAHKAGRLDLLGLRASHGAAFVLSDGELWLIDLRGVSRAARGLPPGRSAVQLAANGPDWTNVSPARALPPFAVVRVLGARLDQAARTRIMAEWCGG